MIEISFTGIWANREPIKLVANTLREALKGLSLVPGFRPHETPDRFMCKVDRCNTVFDLDEPLQTNKVVLHCEQLLSAGALQGGGRNPYVRIVIGIVLIVVAYFTGNAAAAESGLEMVATAFMAAGASLVIGGLSQLMMPKPGESKDDDRKSYSSQRYANTVDSGTPVAIVVGKRHRWGGHLFSLNIETKAQQSYRPGDGTFPWDNVPPYARKIDEDESGYSPGDRYREHASNQLNPQVTIRRDSWTVLYNRGATGETLP